MVTKLVAELRQQNTDVCERAADRLEELEEIILTTRRTFAGDRYAVTGLDKQYLFLDGSQYPS